MEVGSSRPKKSVDYPLTIVIPAHNEQKRIEPTLRLYFEHFKNRAEIVVVLNGCTDNTLGVVDGFRRSNKAQIHIINVKEPIGKGGAVRLGFLESRGERVGFVDADGATSPEEFDRLASLVGKYDGVIASRWKSGARVYNRSSFLRSIASIGFRVLTRALFRLPFADTQCGAKIFSRKLIDEIAPQLQSRDMTFDVELLLRSSRAGYRVHEEPTIWTDQSSPVLVGTPLKLLRTSISMMQSLFRLKKSLS